MAGREKLGGKKNKLQTERLGFFATEILGRADPAHTLRELRSGSRAGKRFAGEIAEGEIYETTDTGDRLWRKWRNGLMSNVRNAGGKVKERPTRCLNGRARLGHYIGYCIAENLKSQAPISKQIQNSKFKKKTMNNWLPVDMYVGGTEHATRHLIYARCWHKFLYDIGIVGNKEPFASLKIKA